MLVSDEDRRKVAQTIELKRRLVRLRRELDSALKAHSSEGRGTRSRLDGRPLDPASLPPEAQEKYRSYQQALAELNQLRSSLSPELRNLIDPQIAC